MRIPPEQQEMSDSALILRCWQKWGEGCLKHLVGDYVFVIADPKKNNSSAPVTLWASGLFIIS
ncbi:MAG: hypothetical protein D3909_18645 [Candidatus Electrothrix sp. ATG1]|nr:hypothetical protein [Candidatus Electrothrix sp. ATG1]